MTRRNIAFTSALVFMLSVSARAEEPTSHSIFGFKLDTLSPSKTRPESPEERAKKYEDLVKAFESKKDVTLSIQKVGREKEEITLNDTKKSVNKNDTQVVAFKKWTETLRDFRNSMKDCVDNKEATSGKELALWLDTNIAAPLHSVLVAKDKNILDEAKFTAAVIDLEKIMKARADKFNNGVEIDEDQALLKHIKAISKEVFGETEVDKVKNLVDTGTVASTGAEKVIKTISDASASETSCPVVVAKAKKPENKLTEAPKKADEAKKLPIVAAPVTGNPAAAPASTTPGPTGKPDAVAAPAPDTSLIDALRAELDQIKANNAQKEADLRGALEAADRAARAAQEAAIQNNQRNDGNLDAALRALSERNNDNPTVNSTPAIPQQQPENPLNEQAQRQPVEQPEQPQPAQPQQPMMLPPQNNGASDLAQALGALGAANRFGANQNSAIPSRNTDGNAAQTNSAVAGMLEQMRLENAMRFAQQQQQQQQGIRPNVNSLSSQLSGGRGRVNSRMPVRGSNFNPATSIGGAGALGSLPYGSRSTVAPSTIRSNTR